MPARHRRMLLYLNGTAMLNAGCMIKPLWSVNANGTYRLGL